MMASLHTVLPECSDKALPTEEASCRREACRQSWWGGQAMFSLDSVALPHLGRVGTMSAKAGAGDTRVRTASWDM